MNHAEGWMIRSTPPDFRRDVHCVFGLPFDAVSERQAVDLVREAARSGRRLFLSTPNLSFAAGCRQDDAFRMSVVNSDLSTADGAPIVWLARVIGAPLTERVTGSNIFDRLAEGGGHRVATYFFGGPDGVAERAHQRVNAAEKPGMHAVGHQSPGFRPVEAVSGPAFTDPINASGAEFVVVALGARKGQAWIARNWAQLQAPVISHLGAVVNFAAGTVKRAPGWLQRTGMEWLWRVKEEPDLWRRYWNDGWTFLAHLFGQAVPMGLMRRLASDGTGRLEVSSDPSDPNRLVLRGEAGNGPALHALREALTQGCARGGAVALDLRGVRRVDTGFIALVQLLDGWQRPRTGRGVLEGVPPAIERHFRRAGAGYVLEARAAVEPALRDPGTAEAPLI